MEDKKLNEKESLELITQMIQNTRRNLDTGSGNMFLVWGYVSVLVTLTVLAGVYFTKNPLWMWGFWGIPVIGYLLTFLLMRKRQKMVKSYIDKILVQVWRMFGLICMIFVLMATRISNSMRLFFLWGLLSCRWEVSLRVSSFVILHFLSFRLWGLCGV